jgi:type II secretory pathway pseudopilin PulG
MKKPFYQKPFFYLFIIIVAGLIAIIIPTIGSVTHKNPKIRDVANLRQLGQASLIYAQDHKDYLPEATDVWDYARLLAKAGIINDGRYWQSHIDPATSDTARDNIDILLPPSGNAPRELNPVFRTIKPTVAVALGKLHMSMPSTTPILWTRGLQPNGTWAPHSPYGTHGGYIMFLGGNIAYFRNLSENGGQLISRDGNKTANILDALPLGTRIGEYEPTSDEKKAWSKMHP